MALEMIIFNVKRGLCVFIRTPNNYGVLIDCASSQDFSPIKYIKNNLPTCKTWNNSLISYFILTHPHSDHISDISNLNELLHPALIYRQVNLDWDRVRKSNQSNTALDYYLKHLFPPNDYGVMDPIEPDWGDGMELIPYSLPPAIADEVSSSDSEYVNNTSIVTIIKYKGYCFAITGDILSEGLKKLLELNESLKKNILGYVNDFGRPVKGVHFFFCPHHGHQSGFCSNWFIWSGPTRKFNIVSERRKSLAERPEQTAISSKYSQDNYSLGDNRENRKMISTKSGKHIRIEIHDDGKWTWEYFSTNSTIADLVGLKI